MRTTFFLQSTCPPLLILCCQLFSASPVVAQEVQYRGSRETAGYIEQRGWENGLVRANPNLSHFNWSPMTTMIQAPVVIRVGTEVKMNPPHNREAIVPKVNPDPPVYKHTAYIKPDHVATPTDEPGDKPNNDLGGKVVGRHYIKPIKADLNGSLLPRRYIKPIHEDVTANLLSRNTAAQLVNQTPLRTGPAVASYGEGPHVAMGTVVKSKADVNGSVVSRGRLIH